MKYAWLLCLPLLVFAVGAEEKEAKCPISGKAVDPAVSINVNGQKVSFCCEKCKAPYEKQINLSAEPCKTCPVSGKPAKAENSIIEKKAEMVHFCCDKCPKAFAVEHKFDTKDEGAKTCPISGKPAKDAEGTSLVVNGKKVYFCCDKCPKAYLKSLGIAADAPVGNCPVSKKPGKAENAQILISSKTVSFCCENCPKKYTAEHFKDGVLVPAKAEAAK